METWIGVIKDIITIAAILIGAWIALFVYFQFAPVIGLTITPVWQDPEQTRLLVRYEITNQSRVRVNRPRIMMQVLEHDLRKHPEIHEGNPVVRF